MVMELLKLTMAWQDKMDLGKDLGDQEDQEDQVVLVKDLEAQEVQGGQEDSLVNLGPGDQLDKVRITASLPFLNSLEDKMVRKVDGEDKEDREDVDKEDREDREEREGEEDVEMDLVAGTTMLPILTIS